MGSNQARREWLAGRVPVPSARSSAEWAQVPAHLRAHAFFSARVAEKRILERIKSVSDRFSRNEIDFGTAQAEISRFLVSEGYDAENPAISNLASTARINLILRQNAAMAAAVGRYSADMEPESLERWPFWKYHARGDDRTRSSHAAYDGKIYRKTDPIWHRIFPPWEFNCRCWVEEVDEEEAEADGGAEESSGELPPVPESGFEFDPADAFRTGDMSSLAEPAARQDVYREMDRFCSRNDAEYTLKTSEPFAGKAEPRPPKNLDEISNAFDQLERAMKEREEGQPPQFPEFVVELGRMLPEHAEALGIPADETRLLLTSPGSSDYGPKHWRRHHVDTMNSKSALELLNRTLWNPQATAEVTLGKQKRITIREAGGAAIVGLWKTGEGWVYNVIDAWEPPENYYEQSSPRQRKK